MFELVLLLVKKETTSQLVAEYGIENSTILDLKN